MSLTGKRFTNGPQGQEPYPPLIRPTELERLLAGWLHGADCTCPHAVELADLARAADLLWVLRINGWRVAPVVTIGGWPPRLWWRFWLGRLQGWIERLGR
jgi:hypothetical protein